MTFRFSPFAPARVRVHVCLLVLQHPPAREGLLPLHPGCKPEREAVGQKDRLQGEDRKVSGKSDQDIIKSTQFMTSLRTNFFTISEHDLLYKETVQ